MKVSPKKVLSFQDKVAISRGVEQGEDSEAQFQADVFSGKHDGFFKTMERMLDGKKMTAKDMKEIGKAIG